MTACAEDNLFAGWTVEFLTARTVEKLSPGLPVAPLSSHGF